MSISSYNYSNQPVYRFYLTQSTVTVEVFPLGFQSTKLVKRLQADQVFYRTEFSGKLTFGTNSTVKDVDGITQNRRDDWDLLWAFVQDDPCQTLYLTITKTVSGVADTYCECYFAPNDGLVDADACTFEVEPKIFDDYTYIFEYADVQYNILALPDVVTVRAVDGAIDETFNTNRWLWDVIEYLCNVMLPGVTVSSTFFNDTPNNPVTLAANKLNYLTICRMSDAINILKASGDMATIGNMSFNELMEILWAMFHVKWKYELSTDTIYVEHISYFTPTTDIDIRTQLTTVATNKYEYIKNKMPKFEKLTLFQAGDQNFIGVPIFYNSTCVDQNNETNKVEYNINVTTDIDYVISNYNSAKSDGWLILSTYLDGAEYKVSLEVGALVNDTKLNMPLSVANLQNNYWRHNRVLINGYLNNAYVTFWSAIKTKSQQCNIIQCEELDPEVEVITELGETYFLGERARIDTAEIQPSGETALTLVYGPEDVDPVPIEIEKSLRIVEYYNGFGVFDWGYFHGYLSEVSGVDLIIKVTPTLYRRGSLHQVCPQVTWTFPNGNMTDDFDVDQCTTFYASQDCIEYEWDFSDPSLSGWIITVQRLKQTICE